MAYATVREIVLQSIVAWAQGLSIHDLCSCKLLVRSSGRASCGLFGVTNVFSWLHKECSDYHIYVLDMVTPISLR